MFGALIKRHWPIGLDIGADSINMIQFRRAGTTTAVNACGRYRFAEGETQSPALRRKAIVKAVREMLRRGFQGRSVITSLSCSDLAIKNIRVPHGEDIHDAVVREAQQRFNFDIGPDQLRYLVAGDVRNGNEEHTEVLMLAVREETVRELLETLAEAGLSPLHIEPEPVPMFRVFEQRLRRRVDEENVSVIVDIGCSGTRVVVARGRDIIFIKVIDIGGRKLNEAVARQLNLTTAEAADMRMRSGRPHRRGDDAAGEGESLNWTLYDAVRSEGEAIAREVALCLRYCSVTFRGLRPERVMLTGGEAHDASLVRLLGEQLNVECQVASPLQGVDLSGVDLGGERRGTLPEWAICAGLAMRGIDLRDDSQETGHDRRRLSA
ncbi:MAG: pilus assembly protein PilM [Planctomycetaceae bacterium]|nr:pilus assembly protein PilM [Planctomycetaceae bacterium]